MSVVRHHRAQENEQAGLRNGKSAFRSENPVPSAKLPKSVPSRRLSQIATRKALGDVSNKRPPKLQLFEKPQRNVEELCTTPSMKPPVAHFTFKTEQKADFDKFPYKDEEIEIMPEQEEIEDDYEDIWPKSERVSVEEFIKWQPFSLQSDECPEEDFKPIFFMNPVLHSVMEIDERISDLEDKTAFLEFKDDDFFI